MGYTLGSEVSGPIRHIPKSFLTVFRIEDGPFAGNMAYPCICGYPTDPEADDVSLIRWDKTGKFMYVHRQCVRED